MDQADLTIAIGKVLDIFAEVDPSKVVEKVKLHILSHGVEDITRFGPLIGMCTEGFESFNGIFRNASIYSNHLAPSRDIAQQLADHEAHKHRLMSGSWVASNGQWVKAGTRIQDFLHHHPTLRRLFGWSSTSPPLPGTFKLVPVPPRQSTRPTVSLGHSHARTAINAASYDLNSVWTPCHSVISCVQDVCVKGSWICAQSPVNVSLLGCLAVHTLLTSLFKPSAYLMGRVEELLASPVTDQALVVIDLFEVACTRHPILNMPWLVRRQGETSYM